MKPETRNMVVGGAVVLTLAASLFLSYGASKIASDAAVNQYTLTATFNRIDGLSEGADIHMGGIPIGVVGPQSLDADYRAHVTLQINNGVKLPMDSSAAIHTDGLFGTKYVVIDPGGDEENFEAGDDITYTQDAVVVTDLLDLIIAQGKAQRIKAGPKKPADGG